MSRNIYAENEQTQIAKNRFGVKDIRNRPDAFRWYTPECSTSDDDDVAAGCKGDEPPLENSWQQPPAPLEKFSFRKHADGSLEFKGHLDASGGASSGDVAVTLPGEGSSGLEVDFRPANDQYFHTTITEDGGSTFTLALVFIDSSSGEVTITWPAV